MVGATKAPPTHVPDHQMFEIVSKPFRAGQVGIADMQDELQLDGIFHPAG